MSSAVFIKLPSDVPIEAWSEFCRKNKLEYHPYMLGGNTYHLDGDESGVQLHFGKGNYGAVAQTPFSPPASGREITVSTFYGGPAMPDVARVAAAILREFPGATYYPSPELEQLMKMQGDFPMTLSCPECSDEHRLEDCPNR
jgi:hypothetical protein